MTCEYLYRTSILSFFNYFIKTKYFWIYIYIIGNPKSFSIIHPYHTTTSHLGLPVTFPKSLHCCLVAVHPPLYTNHQLSCYSHSNLLIIFAVVVFRQFVKYDVLYNMVINLTDFVLYCYEYVVFKIRICYNDSNEHVKREKW